MNLKMNIAIFRNDLTIVDLNSYNSQELGLARGMAALGHNVDIYSVSGSNTREILEIQSEPTRIRFVLLPYWKIPMIDAPVFKRLSNIFEVNKYDLVQINDEGSVAAFHIAMVCHRRKIPYVIYQGMYKLLSGRSRALYEKIHHLLFRSFVRKNANSVFTKTSKAAEYLATKGFTNIKVVPIGIDLSAFSERLPHDWKTELQIPENRHVLLYVGVLEPRRRPHFMLDLVSELGSEYHLVIAGDGPLKAEVSNLTKQSNLSNVSFVGKLSQSDLPSLYEQTDVFILPSNFEIYGMVVLEALSFGLPVVSSATAGPIDILNDKKLGFVMKDFHLQSWVDAVNATRALNLDLEATEFRRLEVRDRYNWTNIARSYLEHVQQASAK